MPVAALAFVLLPFSATAFWTLIAADVVFLVAMTVLRAPVIALMPDHVAPERRSTANGMINLMGGVGGLVAFFALAPLYDLTPWLPFAVAGALLLVAVVVLARAADRHPAYVAEGAGTEEAAPLAALVRDARRLLGDPHARGARWALVAIFLYFIGFAGVEAQFTTYAVGALGVSGGLAGLLLGGFSLAFVAASLPAGLLGTRLGKARAMGIGLAVLPVLFLALAVVRSVPATAAVLVLAGAAWALVNVQAYPLVADLGGRDRIGFFTGLYYLFSMGAAVLAPALAGAAMDAFGLPALFPLAAVGMAAGALALAQARRLGVDGARA
jgi:MFS family permease